MITKTLESTCYGNILVYFMIILNDLLMNSDENYESDRGILTISHFFNIIIS